MQELLEEPRKDEILIRTNFLKIPTKLSFRCFFSVLIIFVTNQRDQRLIRGLRKCHHISDTYFFKNHFSMKNQILPKWLRDYNPSLPWLEEEPTKIKQILFTSDLKIPQKIESFNKISVLIIFRHRCDAIRDSSEV